MTIFATYAAYLAISVLLTVAAGWALARSGRVFLTSVFGGDERLAGAVSRLLVVGFYLLNLGFVTLTVSTSGQIASARQAFGVLFSKIGAELLVLGALYLATIVFFTWFRRRQPPAPDPAPRQAPPPPRDTGAAGRPGSPAVPGLGALTFWRPAPGRSSPGPWQAVH
jgi:hypothetical protein